MKPHMKFYVVYIVNHLRTQKNGVRPYSTVSIAMIIILRQPTALAKKTVSIVFIIIKIMVLLWTYIIKLLLLHVPSEVKLANLREIDLPNYYSGKTYKPIT